MSLPIATLDTVYPPTWDGDPLAIDPVVDATTALRSIVGDDPVNYFVQQRAQGDLFHRDLALLQGINNLADFLRKYTGLVWNCSNVSVAPGQQVTFARGTVPYDTEGYVVVALGTASLFGTSANAGVRLLDAGGAEVASVTTVQSSKWPRVEPDTDVPDTVANLRAVVYNDDPSVEFVLSGWVVLLPYPAGNPI